MNDTSKAPAPGAHDEHSGLRTGGVETIAGGDQDAPERQAEKAARTEAAKPAAEKPVDGKRRK